MNILKAIAIWAMIVCGLACVPLGVYAIVDLADKCRSPAPGVSLLLHGPLLAAIGLFLRGMNKDMRR